MPYALYPISQAQCPMGNISLDFFRCFEISKIRHYLGTISPFFFFAILKFRNYEITKLFGEKISRFLCYYQISKLRSYLDNIFYHWELQESGSPKITKLRNCLEINLLTFFTISKLRNYLEKPYALCPMPYR